MRFPIIHIPQLLEQRSNQRDGLPIDAVADLLSSLKNCGAATPGFPGLLAGWLTVFSLESPFLLLFGGETTDDLVTWMMTTSQFGASSGWLVDTTPNGPVTALGAEATPLLWGHGVIPILHGPGHEPLTQLAPGKLRDRLEASRDAFAQQFGWQPTWIAPPAPMAGAATDQLVERELRRAGFRRIVVPAQPTGPDAGVVHAIEHDAPLPFRIAGPSDDISQLREWVRGSWSARSASRLRQLKDTPRRIADRLFGES